jgi:hypothetical protein
MMVNSHVLITLILLSALGAVVIPFGNPKSIAEAIVVELSFIKLSVLIWRGYTKALYGCIALASGKPPSCLFVISKSFSD